MLKIETRQSEAWSVPTRDKLISYLEKNGWKSNVKNYWNLSPATRYVIFLDDDPGIYWEEEFISALKIILFVSKKDANTVLSELGCAKLDIEEPEFYLIGSSY